MQHKMVAMCMIYLCLLSQVLGKIMAPFEDHNMGTLSGELTRAESSEAQVGRTYLRRLESNSQSSSYSHSMGYSSSASYSGSTSGYSSMSYSGSMSSLSYSSLSYSSLSYSSLSYSSFYSFSQLYMSTPTTMPTGIPSAEPSGLPTGIPTLEPTGQPTVQPTGEPTEFVVEIEVKVGHVLNGFPNTTFWYRHKALEFAYRRTVADRIGVQLQFVSEVNVTDVYSSARRRLQTQTISGISTEVDVQIPNPESGATQDDVTASVAAALSDEPTGSVGGGGSFLDAFVQEVQEVSEEAQASGDGDLVISSEALDETVGAVEAIESKPVVVEESIMTEKPTSRPTSVPTLAVNATSSGDDAGSDSLVIIIVSVIGGLALLGLGGYYMLTQTALKSVMPVRNIAQEDVASSSIVPGPG